MSHATLVEAGDSGAVVVRRATGADAVRLRALGERLGDAAHPGVVEVVSSGPLDEDGWELRLAHGGRPVGVVGALRPGQVAALAAAVAATLADLHATGIVHGRLDASHVLIGPDGRPLLCGFAVPSELAAEPADDVAALGELIVSLLGDDDAADALPERRWHRRPSSSWERRTLLVLADQASAEAPSRRPSARRFAAALSEAFPGAAAEVRGDLEPPPSERVDLSERPPARRAALLLAVSGVLTLAVGAARVGQPGADRPVASPTTASRPSPPTPCVRPPDSDDRAGCAPVDVEGTTVQVGELRYQVGEPGDRLVLGDWDCDGNATPALLRPATGEVFVFPEWTTHDDLVVPPTGRVQDAVALLVEAGADGCAIAVARRADGSTVTVGERVSS